MEYDKEWIMSAYGQKAGKYLCEVAEKDPSHQEWNESIAIAARMDDRINHLNEPEHRVVTPFPAEKDISDCLRI